MTEGYIKFRCDWIDGTPPLESEIIELNIWRSKLYKLGFIGSYPDGIGFGNVSIRSEKNEFIITGTQTGAFETLNTLHYTRVIDFDIARNYVKCCGKIKASSESMTHAVIYQALPEINSVFHIHSIENWKKLLNIIPTTSDKAEYGTPEMAYEIMRLLKETDLRQKKILVMAGHEEGILSFGTTIIQAGKILFNYI
jgi:L-ribulose-5-phosphate 4-epimerase